MNSMIRAEWHLLVRDYSLGVALLLLIACMLFAAHSGQRYGAQWQAMAETDLQQSRTRLAGQVAMLRSGEPEAPDVRYPSGTPGSVKIAVPAAVPPLAHFSIGQSDLYPRSTEIGLFSRTDNLFKQYQIQSPLTLASGRFDLAYVVIMVLPLFVIMLCFDLITTDRVSGRLTLLTVQSGSAGILIMRRLALRAAVLILPLAILFIWGIVSGALLAPLLWWIGIAILYALFWLLLCAVIALRSTRPEMQVAQLVSLWLVLVLILPAGINRLVEQFVPPPSQQTFQAAMRDAEMRANRRTNELLQSYLSNHPELTVSGNEEYAGWMKRSVVMREAVEAETQLVIAAYEAQLAYAHRTAQFLQFLSPAALVQMSLSDAAGTTPEHHATYVKTVRKYKDALQAYLVPPLYQGRKLDADELETLPIFTAPQWKPVHGGSQLEVTVVFLITLCSLLAWWLRRAAAVLSPNS